MASVQIKDKTNGKGAEIRILKQGRYDLTAVEIVLEVNNPKAGKKQIKIATISGLQGGKEISFRTVDMELVDQILAYSEANDTTAVSFDAVLPEGSRYLDWSLVI